MSLTTYSRTRVEFPSAGLHVVGHLLHPQQNLKVYPALVLLGPLGFVKEQSPVQYATRLARAGYITLIFDPRFHGESPGEPRRFESGKAKVTDIKAAISYLAMCPEVDAQRIYGIGICQGVNWMIQAAVEDDRLRKIGLVAGNYLTPEFALQHLGSAEALQHRIRSAQVAKQRFDAAGEVDYIPIVAADNPDALLPTLPIYQWYMPWSCRGPFFQSRGLWENRITRMSEAELWQYDTARFLEQLRIPTLMIHSNLAATGAEIPRSLFKRIAAQSKQLVWFENQVQSQFYEDPYTIDRAVDSLQNFFALPA